MFKMYDIMFIIIFEIFEIMFEMLEIMFGMLEMFKRSEIMF